MIMIVWGHGVTSSQPVEKLSYFKATSIGKLYSSDILNDPVKKF
jgi:hypothetical protein